MKEKIKKVLFFIYSLGMILSMMTFYKEFYIPFKILLGIIGFLSLIISIWLLTKRIYVQFATFFIITLTSIPLLFINFQNSIFYKMTLVLIMFLLLDYIKKKIFKEEIL